MPSGKTVLIIAGPTGVGKTGVAVALAKRFGTSIVSADSRQCYQGMTIGTAQPSAAELAAVPHYFINKFPVTTELSAADYERLALGYLDEIFAVNDTAVVCGGTGLYIRALCEGLDEMPAVNEQIDKEVNEGFAKHGLLWLQEQLKAADPAIFEEIDTNNPARIIRALSFVLSTGKSLLDYQTRQKKERPFNIRKIGLELPRPQLYDRINTRVDQMMEQGLLEEATALFPQRHLKNLQTVGYSELFDYIEGKTTLEQAIILIKQHSRNYAKRQLTWFKKDTEMHWLAADDARVVDLILQGLGQH